MLNIYRGGILFGKMVLELRDTCSMHNNMQDLLADLEFKIRGFISSTYNAIAGQVKHSSTKVGQVNDKWSVLMEFKAAKVHMRLQCPLLSVLSCSYTLV